MITTFEKLANINSPILTNTTQIDLLIYLMSASGVAIIMTAIMRPLRELLLIKTFRCLVYLLAIIHSFVLAMTILRIVFEKFLGCYLYDFILLSLTFISSMWIMQLLIPLIFYQFESSSQMDDKIN